MKKFMISAAVLATLVAGVAVAARSNLSLVGSSTVFPFASAVAERFAAGGKFGTPKVESTGTGGGMAIFCKGVGVGTPDIVNASRLMKLSEYQSCQRNGVKDIVQVKIGFDGIVLANAKSAQDFALTKQQIYMAVAKTIPYKGKMIPNPFKTWNQIDPSLPNIAIDIMGPPPTSGTRDAFAEIVLENGARNFAQMENMRSNNENNFKAITHQVREDGAWKDAGENDNLIVQGISRNPNMLGIFGYSFYEENADRLQAATINGRQPTFDTIASGAYPVSRSLYFYIKKQNIGMVPGIQEFAAEFLSPAAAGSRGYLRGRGMVPLPEAERAKQAGIVSSLALMPAPKS